MESAMEGSVTEGSVMEGRVALVTGAARGQGRSHAVALAKAGADLLLVDICAQIDTCNYPLSSPSDLAETAALVEAHGRKAVTVELDVRDGAALETAVADAVPGLGGLHVVVANAAICPIGRELPPRTYTDVLGVVYGGVVNTIGAALPHLGAGASIIVIGSTASLRSSTSEGVGASGYGGAAYAVGKKALIPLVHDLAYQLGPRSIRVNAVLPGNTNTRLLHNDGLYRVFRPDLENPTRAEVEQVFGSLQRIPSLYMEPSDITAAVVFLASADARFVTGQNLAVDGGALLIGT
jgi:SDR family mycofactocin-dependent oxidoreductase